MLLQPKTSEHGACRNARSASAVYVLQHIRQQTNANCTARANIHDVYDITPELNLIACKSQRVIV